MKSRRHLRRSCKAQSSTSSPSKNNVRPSPTPYTPVSPTTPSSPTSSHMQDPEPLAIFDPRSMAVVVFDPTLADQMKSPQGTSSNPHESFKEGSVPSSSSVPLTRKRKLFKDGSPVQMQGRFTRSSLNPQVSASRLKRDDVQPEQISSEEDVSATRTCAPDSVSDKTKSPPKRTRAKKNQNFKSAQKSKTTVEDHVATGSATKKSRSSGRYVLSRAFSKRFYSVKNKETWHLICGRKILSERNVYWGSYKDIQESVLAILNSSKMTSSISLANDFSSTLIYEFYANLDPDIATLNSPRFGLIYVRNHVCHFSPLIINDYLGCPSLKTNRSRELERDEDMDAIATELTGKNFTWSGSLRSAELTIKYSVFHKLALANWLPSLHPTTVNRDLAMLLYLLGTGTAFDMGRHIFETVVSYADAPVSTKILPFPCLIHGILTSQQPDLIEETDSIVQPRAPMKISPKLLKGEHLDDVKGEQAASSHAAPGVASSSATSSQARVLTFLSSELQHVQLQKQQLAEEQLRLSVKESELMQLLESFPSGSASTAPAQGSASSFHTAS